MNQDEMGRFRPETAHFHDLSVNQRSLLSQKLLISGTMYQIYNNINTQQVNNIAIRHYFRS